MSRLLALALALAVASAAHAQTPIADGETVSGTLSASDSRLDDGSSYDLYVYRGAPGETVVFTMRSSDLDAFLAGGTPGDDGFELDRTDDDSAGGTDAELTVTLPGGDYLVRANSLAAGEAGRYTLAARSLGGGRAVGGTVLRSGDTARGQLSAFDTALPDGSYVDVYTYEGDPGDQVTVTMRSSDFDAYLTVGTQAGALFTPTARDDDSAGGTDAQLQATVGHDGRFVIRANSLSAGETGQYTLSVLRVGGGALVAAEPLAERATGRLAAGDARLADDSYYDLYVYRGAPGEAVEITMTSADFDTYLAGGTTADAAVRGADADDDGGGGTNSRLRVQTGPDGAYYVRANSLLADQTGAYALAVRQAGSGDDATAGLPALALGRPVQGRLDATDATLDDGSFYDAYVYQGTAGEEVMITLSSSDFDAYAMLNRSFGGELEAVANDDDGGAGTDARIRATLGQSGAYVVVANTFAAGASGAYTLTVERPTGPDAADTAGFPSVLTGQAVTGALAASDRRLQDDSYVDTYLYRGTPGDQVTATLRSSDFDAYLIVASRQAGDLTTVGQDNDGAGGRDARVTFTVGGDGLYAIQANSFGAGETGAYSLVVERAGGAVAETEAPSRRFVGKWAPATYLETAALAEVRTDVQTSRRLEAVVERLNAAYPLPRNVPVSFDECGYPNASYSYYTGGPRVGEGSVTFCYEMMTYITNALGRHVPAERLQEAVSGAYEFIMLHEVGHALRHQLDLPITGREEDMADQFATLVLARQGDKGAQAAVDGVLALQDDREFGESDYADEHSLGPQRYYNVACWVYGSNPDKYAGLVGEGGLPEARAERCPGEYAQLEKSFGRLLEIAYGE